MENAVEKSKARRGRRSDSLRARNRKRATSTIDQLPWGQPRNPYPPMQLVSEDELQSIHDTSLDVLEEIGIDFINEDAKKIIKKAGGDVDPNSDRVRFDRAMVEEVIQTAPAEFTVHSRNPERNVHIGGNWIANCLVGSPVSSDDLDSGRRTGNTEDFRKFLRLAQYFNILHVIGGYPVEPIDRHPAIRHLECIRDMAKLTDKVFHAYSLSDERIKDGIELARIVRGISYEQLEQEPSLISIINSSSPLRLDDVMLNGIINMSSHNQVIVMTPFTLAGAMAPVTLAGALAQQNAEALAGIVMTQLVRPGAPVIYGGFTSNVDMKSGAPAFGTPEYMKTAIIGG
ncbi:MAG: trimethylamine methyltransferase family protein, partial [Hyphomicrobiales bacterium]